MFGNSKSLIALCDIPPGNKVKVASFGLQGSLRQRMLDMGLHPGVEVQVVGIAPLGDPIEISVKGYNLTLRKNEAAGVYVEV